MNNDLLLINLHIPKTAGSTLRTIINKQFCADEVYLLYKPFDPFVPNGSNQEDIKQLWMQEASRMRCIQGHLWYGIHHCFFCNESEQDRSLKSKTTFKYTYITMLREPVERVISFYYHILENPWHYLYEKATKMSLEEFVTSDDTIIGVNISNLQVRYLTGLPRDLEKSDLKIAKNNIIKDFAVIGITERFDQSIWVMKNKLNWNEFGYSKENVTINRPSIKDIPQSIIEIIKEKNKLDMELYHFGEQLLEKDLRRLNYTGTKEQFPSKNNIVDFNQ